MTIGERIKESRRNCGLTQKQLAEKIGVAEITIRQYESNKREPRIEQLRAIASVLKVSVNSLISEEKIIIPGRLKITEVNNPESEHISYSIEAADAEAYAIGLQIFENAGIPIGEYTPQSLILEAFSRLNPTGQSVAVERVEELTKIPDYQRQDADPAATSSPTEGE